jgi:hypothetical protein
MIKRTVVLTAILLAVTVSSRASVLKGTCSKGDLAFSDGVPTGAVNGTMRPKDYQAMLKKQRAEHLTQDGDGFLWSKQPFQCDSASIVLMDDYKGHTMVTFGDPNKPTIGFAGGRINGDGPWFFSDTIYLADGKAVPLNSDGSRPSCYFYFTDHGTFTQGWESHLTGIGCELRVKVADGHLISADVRFDVTQTPVVHPSRDPATDHP